MPSFSRRLLLAKSLTFLGFVLTVLLPNLSIGIATRAFLSLRKFAILPNYCFGSDSRLMKLQNFSQLKVSSWFVLVLISFCNLFVVDLVLEY